MSILSNSTLADIENSLAKKNQYLSMINELVGAGRQYTIGDWTPIKAMIQDGTAHVKFPIGTQFLSTYTDTSGTAYALPWDLVSFEDVELADGTTKKGMVLQAHYATVESIQFDAPEPSNPDANIKTKGYNRYSQSAVRQWLNSEELKNNWWTAQSEYDVAPSQLASINGFLHGLDSTFKSGITAVKHNIACNTVTDAGVTDTICDKIFIPSVEEMYGSPQAVGVEGEYFHYWKDATELTAPSNSANNGRIIYALNAKTSAQYCWLRSASRGLSYNAWLVYTSGNLGGTDASGSIRCAPACVIA